MLLHVAGIVGTHRFCSSRDLGDQCQDMRFPDHSRKYRGCIYTCSADGCNAAPTLSSQATTVASLVAGLMVVMRLLWRWTLQICCSSFFSFFPMIFWGTQVPITLMKGSMHLLDNWLRFFSPIMWHQYKLHCVLRLLFLTTREKKKIKEKC